jgi:DNA (cytosine-5)-methyltransferase 1
MLFKEYLRVISEINPSYVVMENVEGFMDTILYDFKGLKDHVYEGQNYIVEILLKEFESIGYKTLDPRVLDASDYGVPQRRNRAIFIAYKPELSRPSYPEPLHAENSKVTVLEAIGDLITDVKTKNRLNKKLTDYQKESRNGRTPHISGQPIKRARQPQNHEFSNHADVIIERFSLYNNGEDTSSLRKRILNEGIDLRGKTNLITLLSDMYSNEFSQDEIVETFKSGKADADMVRVLLTKKNNRMKLDMNYQSPTVLTLPDDFVSPFENRIFSVRELARLQSFDDSFVFQGKRTTGGPRRKVEVPQYTQVGNAVPPLLSKAVAKEIMKAIKDNQEK